MQFDQEERRTINLCGKWKKSFFHCIFTLFFVECAPAKHWQYAYIIYIYFFHMQCRQLTNIHYNGMTLKIHYYLHLRDTERDWVRKTKSQTHFSDRILNYVLMSDCSRTLFYTQLTQSSDFGFERFVQRMRTALKIYSVTSFRFVSFLLFLLPRIVFDSLVNFKLYIFAFLAVEHDRLFAA